MTDKVVDASAVVALLFNELTHEEIASRLRDATLWAPSLIEFEVANACLKKVRAAPAEREALTGRVTTWLLRTATLAGAWFGPGTGHPTQPGPGPAVMFSAEDAELWLRVEVDNWLGALRSAAAALATAGVRPLCGRRGE